MVKMNSRITIDDRVFENQVSSVETNSTWKQITQTAKFKLPRFQKLLDNRVTVGDAVKIELGYDKDMRTEFEGYISSRSYNSPLEFECEDAMWLLKQRMISKYYSKVKLKDLIQELVPGADLSVIQDITISPLRLDRVTVAGALQKLKEEFGLVAYYRGNRLFAGLAYTETGLGEVKFHFQKNVPLNECKLEWKEEADVKIKVKAISIKPDNTHIEMELGDTDGNANQTTLHFYNLTATELKKQAEDAIGKLKYTGYRGSLRTFGRPWTTHGMVAELIDTKYTERGGKYFIDGVQVRYDESGYRRDNLLGRRFAA